MLILHLLIVFFIHIFAVAFCQAAPKSLSQLFNGYAKPCEMWDVCLEVVGFSTHSVDSADVVLRLWDWYLLQGASSSADSGPNAVLEEACARVERLGVKFYTNEAAFPMEHVTLRLHQIAAGLWPERDYAAPVVNGPQRVATAVVQSARGSADKVLNYTARRACRCRSVCQSHIHGRVLYSTTLLSRILISNQRHGQLYYAMYHRFFPEYIL
jgi:nuclear pore complex protein Nup155